MNGYDSDSCRGYVQHMGQEHRRLNQRLKHLLDRVHTAQPGAAPILQDLEALRAELAAHFREEEAGGCLEEAVSRSPSLAHEVRVIEAEHTRLLRQVDDMIACEQSGRGPIDEELEGFARDLQQHEAREDHVLEHGFNVALDA